MRARAAKRSIHAWYKTGGGGAVVSVLSRIMDTVPKYWLVPSSAWLLTNASSGLHADMVAASEGGWGHALWSAETRVVPFDNVLVTAVFFCEEVFQSEIAAFVGDTSVEISPILAYEVFRWIFDGMPLVKHTILADKGSFLGTQDISRLSVGTFPTEMLDRPQVPVVVPPPPPPPPTTVPETSKIAERPKRRSYRRKTIQCNVPPGDGSFIDIRKLLSN